jgi:hypothetical protein
VSQNILLHSTGILSIYPGIDLHQTVLALDILKINN